MKNFKKALALCMAVLITNMSLFAVGSDLSNSGSTTGVTTIESTALTTSGESVQAIPPTVVILTALALAAICHGIHQKQLSEVTLAEASSSNDVDYQLALLD